MNRRARLSASLLSLATLVGLAAVPSAQNGPTPQITSVPARTSYAPGNVVIRGTNLSLATGARVNGVPVPIIRIGLSRMVVGPVEPQLPGFGTVDVIGGRGAVSAPIEFLPTLAAQRRNTRLDLRLNNGDTGVFIVRFSYEDFPTPRLDEGIYGPRYLRLNSPLLLAGAFPDANPLEIDNLLLPVQIGLLGRPLRLQAQCHADTAGVESYTNQVVLAPIGTPQLP